MVVDIEREQREESDRNPVVSLLFAIRSSFLLFIATLGIVCFLLAMVFSSYIPFLTYDVLAAMFVIWGVSAFVFAVLGYIGLGLIGYH